MRKIGIVMGSDSDLPVVQGAANILDRLGVPYEVHVYSAHRTPEAAIDFAKNAREKNFGVIIAFAGMAAHLAGVLAANTIIPVIGVACSGKLLDGMDALLSTVQMPSGVPVAAVGIGGGKNAALLAAQILALEDAALTKKLCDLREEEKNAVLEKDKLISQKFNK